MTTRNNQFFAMLYIVLLGFCLVFISSCAGQTAAERQVSAEVAEAPAIEPGPALAKATRQALKEAAPELSADQRAKLKKLQAEATAEQTRLRQELGKHQLVLVRTILQPKSSEEEVRILKQRILGLERERTNLFLNSLESAERILGRRDPMDEQFYRAFLQDPPAAADRSTSN